MSTTGGSGRSRRRRGRRGQRGRQDAQQQAAEPQVTQAAHETDAEPAAEPGAGEPHQGGASRRPGDQQEDRRGGGRKRNRGRRNRGSKRPVLATEPTEVLKPKVRDSPVTGTMVMRTLDDVETPGGMTFGCPMLTRTRLGMPFAEGRRMPRCSMGWALHDEEEASLCMRTPDLLDCWKEHPEREAELRGTSESENAAD